MLSVVHDADARPEVGRDERVQGAPVDLDELCRLAAREMIAVALEAELRAWLDAHAEARDEAGRRLVVGNGYARERELTTAAGRVEVKAPRVHDRREGERFSSALLPPDLRRSPKVTEVLPLLYLRGLSTGDFAPALEHFFGSDAGLSASTVAPAVNTSTVVERSSACAVRQERLGTVSSPPAVDRRPPGQSPRQGNRTGCDKRRGRPCKTATCSR